MSLLQSQLILRKDALYPCVMMDKRVSERNKGTQNRKKRDSHKFGGWRQYILKRGLT